MATDLRSLPQQTRALWQRLPQGRRLALVGALLASVAGLLFISTRSATGHAVLFSGLSVEDAGQIVAHLDGAKIPYRLESGGTTITVPEADVHKLRLQLAASGIPQGGGVGFEVFEKQSFGTTSFVEKMNYRRALQGELQRTIASLAVIDRARVHLAIQERSLYRNEDEAPSASVVVKLKPGRALSRAQARGIVHLVSSSVEGLTPGRITILDDTGSVLASGDKDDSNAPVAQQELERTLEKRVLSILEPVVGAGHVAVTVTAELDQAQTERTEELYDPERIALRSEQRTVEGEGAADSAGGVAGARGNLPTSAPGTAPAATPAATGKVSRLSETRNFEVNRIVSRTIGPRAQIKRLHVAVLVDGVPRAAEAIASARAKDGDGAGPPTEEATTADTTTAPAAAPGRGERVPRSKEELDRIASLAREAAGLDPERGDRIEVHSVPFASGADADATEEGGLLSRLPVPISTLALLLAILGLSVMGVLALLMLRGRGGRGIRPEIIQALPARVGDLEAGLPAAALAGGAPPLLGGRVAAELPAPSARDRAAETIRQDAARAARILSQWASDGEPGKAAR